MFTNVRSMGLIGMHSYMINVEIDISGGLPHFDIVSKPTQFLPKGKGCKFMCIPNKHELLSNCKSGPF